MMRRSLLLRVFRTVPLWLFVPVALAEYNGFDVANSAVERANIISGGQPRDGIPALLKPQFVKAAETRLLDKDDSVLGFTHNGEARAYPLKILNWHELVNDTVGGQKILVSYCPLCGTGMIFDRMVCGKERTFGVSGLLYQSDVLMYDHQTVSLWSQLKMEAISGKSVGQKLPWLPSRQMTWSAWREKHPATLVLSTDTGYRRDYRRNPYAAYERHSRTMFSVPTHSRALGKKDLVAGILINGQAKAYPFSGLPPEFTDEVAGRKLWAYYAAKAQSISITDSEGRELPVVIGYWFAWQAFHPKSEIFKTHR